MSILKIPNTSQESLMQAEALIQRNLNSSETTSNNAGDTLEAWLERVTNLVESAAKQLGLSETDAVAVGKSGLLTVANRVVAIIPLSDGEHGRLSLLLSVDTDQTIVVDDVANVLQHAPGALVSFSAAMGASPDGKWVLHRSLSVGPDEGSVLADAVLSSVQLVDFVFDGK
jgi:hypothetical protein